MKIRICTQCKSPKYYCKGLCKKCYIKQLIPSRWSREYDICINCGSSEFPHVAKGLCRRCYATTKSDVLCACGCGEYVSKIGNKVKEYVHGHKIRDLWKIPQYRKTHISLFIGIHNPMYGKFGENHPAYKHKKTDKFRKDSSKRMLERMSKGERKSTDIEIILSKLLDDLNINHKSQTLLYNKFVVDEYLPDFNLVIESFGGYWHGDPRRFSKFDKIQTKNKKRDLSRFKYLNKCGNRVLVLWENELKTDRELCKKEIYLAIKNFSFPLIQDILNREPLS